jgi:hypothetical protein
LPRRVHRSTAKSFLEKKKGLLITEQPFVFDLYAAFTFAALPVSLKSISWGKTNDAWQNVCMVGDRSGSVKKGGTCWGRSARQRGTGDSATP